MRYIILLIFLACAGCGTRKTETSILQHDISAAITEQGTQQASEVKASGTLQLQQKQTNQTTAAVKQTGTFTPSDPTQPMTIIDAQGNATTIYNGKWETGTEQTRSEKQEFETNLARDSLNSTSQMSGTYKAKSDIHASGREKNKNTDRKYSFLEPVAFTIACIILFWYFVIKRKTDEDN